MEDALADFRRRQPAPDMDSALAAYRAAQSPSLSQRIGRGFAETGRAIVEHPRETLVDPLVNALKMIGAAGSDIESPTIGQPSALETVQKVNSAPVGDHFTFGLLPRTAEKMTPEQLQAATIATGGLALAPLASVASGALARAAAPFLGRAAPFAARTLTSGATGAGIGAASNPSDPLVGAAVGGGLGAGADVAAQGAGGIIGKVVKGASNLAPRPKTNANPVSNLITSHEEVAGPQIIKAAQRSGLSLDEYIARAQANPDAPLTQLGPSMPTEGTTSLKVNPRGDPFVRMARGAAAINSEASGNIYKAINKADEARASIVQGELRKGLGVERENRSVVQRQLRASSQAANKPAYQKAYEGEPVDNPEILKAFDDPVFADAYETGRRIAKREGIDLAPLRSPAGEGIEGEVQNPLTVRGLDYAHRALDDVIEKLRNKGSIGSTEAYGLQKIYSDMMDNLDAERPDFAKARAIANQGFKTGRAAEAGRKFFSTPSDKLADDWNGYSPEEKSAYRRIALGTIEEKAADFASLIKGPTADKLKTIFPTEEAYNKFATMVRRANHGRATDAAIATGSHTTPLAQDIADITGNPEQVSATIAALTSPRRAAGALLGRGFGKVATGIGEQRANALEPYLTATGNELVQRLTPLRALEQKQAANRITRGAARSTRRGVIAGVAARKNEY